MSQQNLGESLNFMRPQTVPGTELLIANHSTHLFRVFHETYTLCSCAQANAKWTYRGKEMSLGDHGNMLMEPGEMHCTKVAHKPANYKVLFISPTIVTDAAKELGVPATPHLRYAGNDDPILFSTLYRFCIAVETGESLLEQQSLFTACVRILLENAERRPPKSDRINEHHAIERIKRCLRERYAESVGLDELVMLSGLSRFHLVRTFAKQIGVPPHAYQNNVRVNTACMLLKAGVSPASVATHVGFADQSHFTRHFKRIWGTTPSRYANAVKLQL
jgi:AraC-like DNA-binding protein